MDPRTINRDNFQLNPCSLSCLFSPFHPTFFLSLELLNLYEAFSYAFAKTEGPLLLTSMQPPWTSSITIHQLYITNAVDVKLAQYWEFYIPWFWRNTIEGPLPHVTLTVMLADIKQLLFQFTKIQVSTTISGRLAPYYMPYSPQVAFIPEFEVVRTDFLAPETIINTQALGLQLRLLFDAKRRPRTEWSNEAYLKQHKKLLDAYKRKHDTTGSSTSSSGSSQ